MLRKKVLLGNRLGKIFLFMVLSASFLLLCEGGARFYFAMRLSLGEYRAVSWEHKMLRYEFIPYAKGTFGDGFFAIDARGFRRNPYGVPGKEKCQRIVCLGDSITFGCCGKADDAKTYPSLLQQILNGKRDGCYEVINAGMPRFNSLDALELLVFKVLALKPAMVLIHIGANDIMDNIPSSEQGTVGWRKWLEKSNFLLGMSKLSKKIFGENEREIEIFLKEREKAEGTFRLEAVVQYQRTLGEMVAVCKRNHIVPVLVTWPHYMKPEMSFEEKRRTLLQLRYLHLSYNTWYEIISRFNEAIVAVGQKEGVAVVHGDRLNDFRYFTDMFHLTSAGNQRLAEIVFEEIEPLLGGVF